MRSLLQCPLDTSCADPCVQEENKIDGRHAHRNEDRYVDYSEQSVELATDTLKSILERPKGQENVPLHIQAVFDGHGGNQVATHMQSTFVQTLTTFVPFFKTISKSTKTIQHLKTHPIQHLHACMEQALASRAGCKARRNAAPVICTTQHITYAFFPFMLIRPFILCCLQQACMPT